MPPRTMLMSIRPDLARALCPTMPLVSSTSGTWMLTKSQAPKSSSSVSIFLKRSYILSWIVAAHLHAEGSLHDLSEPLRDVRPVSIFRTADCQAECNISLKTSLAVLYPRTFLALSQISSTACCTSSFVTFSKSVLLGEELAQEPVGVLNCRLLP